jgi:hypothetical protein
VNASGSASPFLVNTGCAEATTREEAVALTADSLTDAVMAGRGVIAIRDLVRRWREGLGQNELDFSTLYADWVIGYTDYPTHDARQGHWPAQHTDRRGAGPVAGRHKRLNWPTPSTQPADPRLF